MLLHLIEFLVRFLMNERRIPDRIFRFFNEIMFRKSLGIFPWFVFACYIYFFWDFFSLKTSENNLLGFSLAFLRNSSKKSWRYNIFAKIYTVRLIGRLISCQPIEKSLPKEISITWDMQYLIQWSVWCLVQKSWVTLSKYMHLDHQKLLLKFERNPSSLRSLYNL